MDRFAPTIHIEMVALLSKLRDAASHIEVTVNMDELDLTSAESKATYEEIKEWVKTTFGRKVSNLDIAQTKRKNGIIERNNYNLPKSSDSKRTKCSPEKELMITEALRHFQMIPFP